VATVRYASGAMGQVEASWRAPARRGFTTTVEIAGSDGRISWDYDSISGGAIYLAGGGVTRLDPLGERGLRQRDRGVHRSGPRRRPVPGARLRRGRRARTALAALHSARTGEPVDLTRGRSVNTPVTAPVNTPVSRP